MGFLMGMSWGIHIIIARIQIDFTELFAPVVQLLPDMTGQVKIKFLILKK